MFGKFSCNLGSFQTAFAVLAMSGIMALAVEKSGYAQAPLPESNATSNATTSGSAPIVLHNEIDVAIPAQFEFLNSQPESNGATLRSKTSLNGSFFAFYHTIVLKKPDFNPSQGDNHNPDTKPTFVGIPDNRTLRLGGWYWAYNGRANRYALEVDYSLNNNFSISVDEGGDEDLGFNETYAQMFYSPTNSFFKHPVRTSIQGGIGPYYENRDPDNQGSGSVSIGQTKLGYNALGQVSYLTAKNFYFQGTIWYISYPARNVNLGQTKYAEKDTYRFTVGIVGKFK